jgi:leucyl aminopeptidase
VIPCIVEDAPDAIPIWPVEKDAYEAWLGSQSDPIGTWLRATEFKPESGARRLIPDAEGNIAGLVLGLGETPDLWCYGSLAKDLPRATYRIATEQDANDATQAALGWALGGYAFTRYRKRDQERASLLAPDGADLAQVGRTVRAVNMVRDLVNTPAADLGPAELAEAVETTAARHGATVNVIVGDELLRQNYPAIHAVGRASDRPPCLIDLGWGEASAPKVTLVGKGVCFDSGGLDLKPAANMLRMKKDMGGAANILGLADMIMDAGLGLRLRVLIPAVENLVSGNAFRPGDVLATRKGTTVEVGNTDAEGRIILADALAEADSETPALIVDMATLTGAARVAVGPDLPALYTDDDRLALDLQAEGRAASDPVWRLPLHPGYAEGLKSRIADLNNVADSPMAGSVTAALFLKSFVGQAAAWAHLDVYAWNDKARPGRPIGGEAQAIRALYRLIAQRYPPT